jgi:hypothetical protein
VISQHLQLRTPLPDLLVFCLHGAPTLVLMQLQQLERERQAEREASEAVLAGLKDQVTAVLNRYLSKDLELDKALQEMQALGIELVPLDPQDSRCEAVGYQSTACMDTGSSMF